MSFARFTPGLAAVLLAGCLGLAAAQERPVAPRPDVARLSPDAAARYAVILPRPDELKWRQIPWLTDLDEGVRQAKQENRPIFLWVSGDDPLERC